MIFRFILAIIVLVIFFWFIWPCLRAAHEADEIVKRWRRGL